MRSALLPLTEPTHGPGSGSATPTTRRSRMPLVRLLALLAALICVAFLGAELVSGWHVLHAATSLYSSQAAHSYVWVNAAAALLIALTALLAPGRLRWLALIAPAALLCAVLAPTAVGSAQVVAMLAAVVTMAAAWELGERLLRWLGADGLAALPLVAWLAGLGPLSLGTILLGRLSLLRWWTAGILVVALGGLGCARLLALAWGRREVFWRELTGSPIALVGAGLILLTCAWAAIYTAAPEIQYDALYGKAYLPELWAQTGHIGSLPQHVQLEVTGLFQVLAVYGHLFGGPAVGRYLQLLGLMLAGAAVWWWGRRHGGLGPLAAVAVVLTPHLFWQASTADDDLLLAVAALAMCVAVVQALRDEGGRERREGGREACGDGRDVRGLAFAMGLMAGTGPTLKLHLIPLFAMLLLAWIAAGRGSRTVMLRLGFASLGAALTSLPPLILRWISTGNPVLPAYNNIFHSSYWLPVNEKANFPFWAHPGTLGPLRAIWESVSHPDLMLETAPPGAFGVLVGAVVFATLFGWYGRERPRAQLAIWFALLPALAYWWLSLRYLRYLLPVGFASVALSLMVLRGVAPRRRRGQWLAVAAMSLGAAASFSVAIAQFWNVPSRKPPVYAALGRWKAASYEDAALPERSAMLAFDRLSLPHSVLATRAFERGWLTDGRELDNLNYEIIPKLYLAGLRPQDADQAYADLRAIGVDWVLASEDTRVQGQANYLSQAISGHGEIQFSARGWDLYRLVSDPAKPVPLSACDSASRGVPACWGAPPGPHGSLSVSVTRHVSVCPGQTLAVSVTQAGGGSSPVLIQFNGGDPRFGIQPGQALAGTTQRTYATVPVGASSANVTVSPIDGASITAATIGRFGVACAATAPAGMAG